MKTSLLLPSLALLSFVTSASAAVTYGTGVTGSSSEVSNSNAAAYSGDVSASDLINGLTPIDNGKWFTSSGRTPANFTDGLHGAAGEVASLAQTETFPGIVVFDLGTGDNGLGYDLSSTVAIASWTGNGFGNQLWTLEVAGVGADGSLASTDFSTLVSADYQPLGGSGGSTKITITSLAGTLTSGVQYVRFTGLANNDGSFGGRTTWRELDIFGTSTVVPEPSASALIGLTFMAFALRRRRA